MATLKRGINRARSLTNNGDTFLMDHPARQEMEIIRLISHHHCVSSIVTSLKQKINK